MLAYVFWHRPRPDADLLAYERGLSTFHGKLAGTTIAGFHGSLTYAVPRLEWLESGGYEDWYLVDSYAALGELAAGAVDAARASAHDAMAASVLDGTAGLYGLVAGTPFVESAAWVGWFTKAPAVGYAELIPRLEALVASGEAATVWQRQLVLGPATEFRVEAPAPLDLIGAELTAGLQKGTPLTPS